MQSTLTRLRRQIERLAAEDGIYRVVCARTGMTPVPVGDARFEDERTARLALGLCRAYRRALRRRDPRTPSYDLVVDSVPEAAPPSRPDCTPVGSAVGRGSL